MGGRIKEFWNKYEYRLVLAVGFLLISAISFEAGYLQGKDVKSSPLVIEKPSESPKNDSQCPVATVQAQNAATAQKTPSEADLALPKDCAFVGSKNSDKFHAASCSWAKRILPKNRVCFKTAEEALAQGRVGDKGCIK